MRYSDMEKLYDVEKMNKAMGKKHARSALETLTSLERDDAWVGEDEINEGINDIGRIPDWFHKTRVHVEVTVRRSIGKTLVERCEGPGEKTRSLIIEAFEKLNEKRNVDCEPIRTVRRHTKSYLRLKDHEEIPYEISISFYGNDITVEVSIEREIEEWEAECETARPALSEE